MESTTIQALIIQLDYSQLWLNSGILTEDILIEQLKELNAGQDNNLEHYRYQTLSNYFKTNASFDDNLLQQIYSYCKVTQTKTWQVLQRFYF